MRSLIKPLTIILVLQLALFAGLRWTKTSFEPYSTEELILTFDEAKVAKLEVLVGEDKLTIEKSANGWTLPTKNNFPADEKKVDLLIDQLSSIERTIPVGSKADTQKQLKVAADQFEKKVILTGEGINTELLLGSSPSFKKNYVRNASEETIFTVDTSKWELNASDKAWLNFEYLYFNPGEVSLYSSDAFELKKDGNLFSLEGKAKTELQQNLVTDFFNRIGKIRFTELLDEDPVKANSKPDLYFSVMLPAGERVYSFYKNEKDNNFILKLSDSEFTFNVPGSYVNEITNTSLDSLLKKEKEAEVADNKLPAEETAPKN